MRSPLTRTACPLSIASCNDTTPDCNLPLKEVQKSWELWLLHVIVFSDYSPKPKGTYYSQIIPEIICQSLTASPVYIHGLPWKASNSATTVKILQATWEPGCLYYINNFTTLIVKHYDKHDPNLCDILATRSCYSSSLCPLSLNCYQKITVSYTNNKLDRNAT